MENKMKLSDLSYILSNRNNDDTMTIWFDDIVIGNDYCEDHIVISIPERLHDVFLPKAKKFCDANGFDIFASTDNRQARMKYDYDEWELKGKEFERAFFKITCKDNERWIKIN